MQPLSLDLQPPLPLQEFFPAQACFSTFLSAKETPADCSNELADDIPEPDAPGVETPAFKRAIVPPRRPVKAAVNTRELLETFMCAISPFFFRTSIFKLPLLSYHYDWARPTGLRLRSSQSLELVAGKPGKLPKFPAA